jgi:NADH-quinone oxidoreductase subunit L
MALAGVFVGGFYSFRLVFFAFHGKERFETHDHHGNHGDHGGHGADRDAHGGKPHESPWVVTVPLILLAIPSIFIGWMTIEPMLYGHYFGGSIAATQTMDKMGEEFHGAGAMVMHSLASVPLWLAVGGAVLAWFLYIKRPDLPAVIKARSGWIATLLDNKYYFDDFNDWFFAGGARRVGTGLWSWGDKTVIDGIMVNGTAKLIGWFAGVARRMQTGYIYHYAFTMIFGVFALLTFFWLYLQKL